MAQAGKSFRNEIRTSNFVFRAREFDQWELQYFCRPDASASVHDTWVEFCHNWLLSVGIKPENVRRNVYEKKVGCDSTVYHACVVPLPLHSMALRLLHVRFVCAVCWTLLCTTSLRLWVAFLFLVSLWSGPGTLCTGDYRPGVQVPLWVG